MGIKFEEFSTVNAQNKTLKMNTKVVAICDNCGIEMFRDISHLENIDDRRQSVARIIQCHIDTGNLLIGNGGTYCRNCGVPGESRAFINFMSGMAAAVNYSYVLPDSGPPIAHVPASDRHCIVMHTAERKHGDEIIQEITEEYLSGE